MMKHIQEAGDLAGKRVLLRAALNVPLEGGEILDDFRLHKALTTINYLREQGARIVVLSHMSGEQTATLRPVHEYFVAHGVPMVFGGDALSDEAHAVIEALHNGEIVLLDNIRHYDGEKANDIDFARQLAALGEVYVQDDFTAAHREHASYMHLPKLLPTYVGFQFADEVRHLQTALHPPHPSLLILAGGKAGTKIPIAKQFVDTYEKIFLGGVPANMFFIAKGYPIGKSVVVPGDFGIGAMLNHDKVVLPTDVMTEGVVKAPTEIQPGEMILDAGPATLATLEVLISEAQFILWNGPLGYYEKGFVEGTDAVARAMATSSAHTVVGGGDSIAAIRKLDILDKFTFVSTAGGAMLDYLADGELPGVSVLEE